MQQTIIEETPRATKKKSTTNNIPIRAFFMACARNWYWFIISAIACTSIAFLYSKALPKLYTAKSQVMFKTKDTNLGSQSQVFSDLGMNPQNSIIGNEIFRVRSTDLLETVANTLGVNIQYYGHVFLRDVNIYKSSPVQITPLREITEAFSMTVIPKGGNDLEFKVNDGSWKKAHFGNKVNTPYGPIAITKNKNYNDNQYKDFQVIARVSTPRGMASKIKNSLTAETATKYADVVNLSIVWDNLNEACDILTAIIAAYNQDAINDKNQVARSTEAFIADRVTALSKDLSGVDSQVAALKTSAVNATIFAEQGAAIKYADNSADAGMQISLAQSIYNYIAGMTANELIPSNTGIQNTGIEGQIQQYNEAVLRYQKISATSSEENPVMIDLARQTSTLKQNIMRGLNNYIQSLQMRQSQARQQQSMASGSMVAVPSQEKAITEVSRQQKIKEQLYMYLLNKREENALQIAITEPNAKVIETPSGTGPISPIPSRIILIGLLIGLLIPALLLYCVFWYYSLDNNIHTRHDIENAVDIPILGELPTRKNNTLNGEVVVTENGRDRISEAMRIIRANIDYIIKPNNGKGIVMQFTSTMSGEGKSFVAVNMALSMAHAGKKVVAVDLDLRKGRFSEYVGLENAGLGVSAYLSNNIENLDQITQRSKFHKNLDIICVGAIPPNPTNLLMSERFTQLIDTLKSEYDYVILDTVPYSIIADAGLINRYSDLTVYVIRDGKIDKRYLNDLEKMNTEGKIKNLTILVNDIKIDSKHYGYGSYGYGYGYGSGYGNYGYGYGYGYGGYTDDVEEKPTLLQRIKNVFGNSKKQG